MKPKKILLVEDEPELAQLMKECLLEGGYEILIAREGPEGLEKARTEKPDLILLDLMLPRLDGHRICGLLKKDRRFAHIPVIILTGKAHDEEARLAREMGAEAFFTKPFQSEALLGKIRELLGGKLKT